MRLHEADEAAVDWLTTQWLLAHDNNNNNNDEKHDNTYCVSQHNTRPARPRPTFLFSDWSCPKTDGLRPYHCPGLQGVPKTTNKK